MRLSSNASVIAQAAIGSDPAHSAARSPAVLHKSAMMMLEHVCASHNFDVTRELSENAASGDLDDTPAASGNRRIDQLAAQPLHAREAVPDPI